MCLIELLAHYVCFCDELLAQLCSDRIGKFDITYFVVLIVHCTSMCIYFIHILLYLFLCLFYVLFVLFCFCVSALLFLVMH